MEEGRRAFKISFQERDLQEGLGVWEDNIRVDLKEIDINTKNWVDFAQISDYWRALVNSALNLRVP